MKFTQKFRGEKIMFITYLREMTNFFMPEANRKFKGKIYF